MKKNTNLISCLVVLLALVFTVTGFAQNTNTASCTGNFGILKVTVPSTSLTGELFPLNIDIPGGASANCIKTVTINTSQELEFDSSPANFPFGSTGNNKEYSNITNCFAPNQGQIFNVYFKFPGGVTCDNTVGTFLVEVKLVCDGIETSCTAEVEVIARATNYWSVVKNFHIGNLTCGISKWRFGIKHDGPKFGSYRLNGIITETVAPVFNPNPPVLNFGLSNIYRTTYIREVSLRNCTPVGTSITNTADYKLVLGNNCDSIFDNVSAISPPMAAPMPDISFSKSSWSNGGLFIQGCQGRFVIKVSNNGNTPWTDLQIVDNLTIPGIQITSIDANFWTQYPPGATSGTVTFKRPGFILCPGEYTYLYINYIVTGAIGTSVTNTATLSYTGAESCDTVSTVSPCPPEIDCPDLDTSKYKKIASTNFTISEPQPIPSIVKCNEPDFNSIPIKQVGDRIRFKIQVGNSGSMPLSSTVTDVMNAAANQNLRIDASSLTVNYYPDQTQNRCGWLSNNSNVIPVPRNLAGGPMSWDWNDNLQNPVFNLTDIPGNCNLWNTNIAVIEFEAEVLPQLAGSKTNTANMGTLSGSANYKVDVSGELGIEKVANKQFVENGDSFNYFLTVSNLGSDPVNNIVITDNMPECVTLNGNITALKGATQIQLTNSGNLVINIDPATTLQPAETIIIKIPVIKVSGTKCCNEHASVTANMLDPTYGGQLDANTDHNIACVESELCCDIEKLTVNLYSIYANAGNSFRLNISSGGIPIQEVDVSLIDYHVEYSEPDCKPADMGMFGTLFSPNLNLGNLVLDNNNTHSLSWELGSPTILNNGIKVNIKRPSILNISCCNGKLYFCLKVSVKDVDCNVCEKIICGSTSLKDRKPDDPWGGGNGGVSLDLTPATFSPSPKMKEAYENMLQEKEIELEFERLQLQKLIQKDLRKMDPVELEEYFEQLQIKNPVKKIEKQK